ncbi:MULTISPECIES: copper resistance CopC/CopD family protein [unclassified Streptomyces]|uniref:copper resistance CopC/CopD family protein n=1 Tax=unclassified Streptomyces TaxID=2593676 RepID=UPI00380B35A9
MSPRRPAAARAVRAPLRALTLLGTVLLLVLLGGAGQASAHAALVRADPADGSVVKTAPTSITLTFTESVGLLDDTFRVFDPRNNRVETRDEGHADGRSDTARVTLPTGLGTGTYTVAWRVVSEDGHPIAGAYTFSVGKPSATLATVPTGDVEDPATEGLHKLARYLAYGGVTLLVGTAAFVALCRPPRLRPLRGPLLTGWTALAVSTVALLLLRAPYESGAGPAQALDPDGLARTLSGRPGIALLARLLLVLVAGALLLLRRRNRAGRTGVSRPELVTGTVLAVALALTWAGAEHASAGIQVPAAMVSSVLHILATAAWIGGLTALLVLLRRTVVPAAVAVRFSRLATVCVVVLALTGLYQSWRGLGTLGALTDTEYGRVLLAKLALVSLLPLAGALSRGAVLRLARAEEEEQGEKNEGAEAPVKEKTETRTETEAVVDAEAETEADAEAPVKVSAGVTAAVGARTEDTVSALADGARERRTEEPGIGKPRTEELRAGEPRTEEARAGEPRVEEPRTPAEDAHRKALRRSVVAEVAVSVLVLGLTTVLTGTLPGRAEAEAATTPASGQAIGLPVASVTYVPFDLSSPETPGARGNVQVTLDPGRVGVNSLQAVVYGIDGGFASIPELRVSFSLPSKDIGPLTAKVTDQGGYWAADAVNLPIPGTWEMAVTVRVSDIDQVTVKRPVRITR